MTRTEKPYVLLIDDNEATGALITAILQREFQVEIVTDGLEAIERFKTATYSAVLLDLRLPHLDGVGVLEHLEAHHPDVLRCVIVLTASVTPAELARVRRFPIADIVTKPFEIETILTTVRNCAGGSGGTLGNVFSSGMILLIADLLRHRWL